MVFGFDHNPAHHGHRLARILPAGSFGRKHHGIRAIEDRVRHIARFRPRGAGIFDHGLQHLGRDDDRFPPLGRAPNHVLLNHRHLLGKHLDAEIAARHHHAVRRLNDLLQLLQSLRLFELGNDGDFTALILDELLHLAHIRRRAYERNCDHVDVVLEPEFQILSIFIRERGNGQRNSRQIDALVLPQDSAIHHIAFHVFPAHPTHAQFNQPVRQQDAGARSDLAGEADKRGRD